MNKEVNWVLKLIEAVEKLEKGQLIGYIPIKREEIEYWLMQEKQLIQKKDAEALKFLRNDIKQLLLQKFEEVMILAGIDLNSNLRCAYHNDTHPSMHYYKNTKKMFCFVCSEGKCKDGFDILKDLWSMENCGFYQLRDRVIELLSKKLNDSKALNKPKAFYKLMSNIYKDAIHDPDAVKFLIAKGLMAKSIQKYDIRVWEYKTNKYICLHCEGKFWIRKPIKVGQYKFWNPKGVNVEVFNTKALKEQKETVFVVESGIDAILVEQCGFGAISINGAENASCLIRYLEKNPHCTSKFIILADNDDAGKKMGVMLGQTLAIKDKLVYVHNYNQGILDGTEFLDKFKDFGEVYLADKEKATKALEVLVFQANNYFENQSQTNLLAGFTGVLKGKTENN
ncbi:MAG: toprim domain-containing protein [Clostridiales bacterium]|nr:toprim domain-containing protein [Clostridiales bacterium]